MLGVGGDFGDLTYNTSNNTLYAVGGRSNNALYTIDRNTGVATLVGNHGVDDMFALAWDSSNGTMYGQSTSGQVYTFNLATGAATPIGSNSVYPGGLAYNASTDQLLLLEAGGGRVYGIDESTGAATLVSGGSGFVNDNGFTWDAELGGYWAADWSSRLYRFDAAFSRTDVAGLGSPFAAIAFVPDAVAAAVPEPTSLALVVAAIGAATAARRRSRRA